MRTIRILVVESIGRQNAEILRDQLSVRHDYLRFEVVGATIQEARSIHNGEQEFSVIVVSEGAPKDIPDALRAISWLAGEFPFAVMLARCFHADCAGKFMSAGCTSWVTHTLDLPGVVEYYATQPHDSA